MVFFLLGEMGIKNTFLFLNDAVLSLHVHSGIFIVLKIKYIKYKKYYILYCTVSF